MGTWGITMRQSDYGLDMLNSIMEQQLQKTDFKSFNVPEAIELLKADILDEIETANRGCSPKLLEAYTAEMFPYRFSQAAQLLAECTADFCRNGELVVDEYLGDQEGFVKRHVPEITATEDSIQILLEELSKVQEPTNAIYQSWFEDSTREAWLAHMRELSQTLKENVQALTTGSIGQMEQAGEAAHESERFDDRSNRQENDTQIQYSGMNL